LSTGNWLVIRCHELLKLAGFCASWRTRPDHDIDADLEIGVMPGARRGGEQQRAQQQPKAGRGKRRIVLIIGNQVTGSMPGKTLHVAIANPARAACVGPQRGR